MKEILKMHYSIFLFVTFGLSEKVTGNLQREISVADGGDGQEIRNVHEYVYRNKRGLFDFWNKSKSVDKQPPKDDLSFTNLDKSHRLLFLLTKRHKKKKRPRYVFPDFSPDCRIAKDPDLTRGNLKVGLDGTGNKIGLEAQVNIMKTDNHLIRTNGSVATNIIPKPGAGWSPTYNGSLEYIFMDKMKTGISVQHDSNSGKNVSADLKVNMLDNDKHKLIARGFFDKNIPRDNASHHSYGSSLDYLHSNKFNVSADVKHSSDTGRTDLELSGTLKSLGGMKLVVGLSKPGHKESFIPSIQVGFGKH